MNGIRYAYGLRGFKSRCELFFRDISKIWFLRENGFGKDSLAFGNSVRRLCSSSVEIDDAGRIEKKRSNYDFDKGPDLADFILAKKGSKPTAVRAENVPYLRAPNGEGRAVYFDIYGCQMNVNDADVVWSILKNHGYKKADDLETADVVLVVTCSIRDGAEQKVWNRLDILKSVRAKRSRHKNATPMKIGILGCMAGRLKTEILEKRKEVDIVAGPDSYKDLPRLLALTDNNETAVNVLLSFDETYADITPVRLNSDSVTAYVTIMRGCDNMCTYCIVPFTRGRERSRPIASILDEVRKLSDQGVKEVTLLGQNVNSYRDMSETNTYQNVDSPTNLARGFKTVYKSKIGGVRFSELLDRVSMIDPEMRIRFTSPHPKDFPDEVLHLIAERSNICQQLHLPAQSGNSAVLERMRRGYTREAYLELVRHIRSIIPNVSLSSDFIAGFCGETDEEFRETITLMDQVRYNKAFLFAYSMREKTTAHRRLEDNVAESVKMERLRELIELWKIHAGKLNRLQIGTQQLVLIEGKGKRAGDMLVGRNDGNSRVVIANGSIPENIDDDRSRPMKPGDYVVVQICDSNSNTLSGIPLYHSTISSYSPQTDENRQRDAATR